MGHIDPNHHHPHKGSHKPRPGARGKHHRFHHEKHVTHKFHHETFKGRHYHGRHYHGRKHINPGLASHRRPPIYRHLHEPRFINDLMGNGPIAH